MIGLNKNAKNVLKELKKRGYVVSIVSINDENLINIFLKKNKIHNYIDYVYASRFVVKDGVLTGDITGDTVRTEKTGVIKNIEKRYKAKSKDIIYIGDGLTDLPIMKLVGKGILFCPSLVTQAEVLSDRKLKKMKDDGRLFLVKEKDMNNVMKFII
jgi:phosphoserine phosphatase